MPGGSSRPLPGPAAKADLTNYRRRALLAERHLRKLDDALAALRRRLNERTDELAVAEAQRDEFLQRLAEAENRILAERIMTDAGIKDLDTAWALLEHELDPAEEPDGQTLARKIERLILNNPFLRSPTTPSPSAGGPSRPTAASLADAAEKAIRTGDPRDVAEYLLLRRKAADRADQKVR